MDIGTLVATIVTSTVVSSAVTFILKSYLTSRIDHHFKTELERYKSELAVRLGLEQGIIIRRLEAYPKIVELVYRTRNMARDLAIELSPANVSLIEELTVRAKELEDTLYRFRIDLQEDGLFTIVHSYKNSILNFTMRLSDIKYFLDQKEEQRAHNAKRDLGKYYEAIEATYTNIVEGFSLHSDQSKHQLAKR